MRAAVLRTVNQPVTIEDLSIDHPHQGEVKVRIEASGICQSDLSTLVGHATNPLPCVLGHEGAGTVVEVGPGVTTVKEGDRVMLSWAPECHVCFYCRTGRPNLCAAYAPRVLDGGLLDGTSRLRDGAGNTVFHYSFLSTWAEEAIVAESSCIPIRGTISMTAASLIGCAVMTGYGAAVKSGEVKPGDTVVVLGAGGVGANAVQGARIAGAARIIVADVSTAKESTARTYGATDFVDLTTTPLLEYVLDHTGGLGADVVIEASGHPTSLNSAYDLARPGGRIVFVGVAPEGATIQIPAPRMPRQEKVITGSFYGGANCSIDFNTIVAYYETGQMLLDEQVEQVVPLERINDAIAQRPTTGVRNVVVFD